MRSFLHKFMLGRYGPDHLCIAMIIFSFVLSLLYSILGYLPLVLISYFVFGLTIFRMLSRNIFRRRAENDKFIRYWWPVRTKVKNIAGRVRQLKSHKVFKCSSCGTKLRVPRGIGKLQVSCTKCGEKVFIRS